MSTPGRQFECAPKQRRRCVIGIWASLDSMEGLISLAPERYIFTHREHVLVIRTETDGRQMRFTFNHPCELNASRTRAKRIRRESKAMIEAEARQAIDELLDQTVTLPKEEYQTCMKELERLRAREKAALRTIPRTATSQTGSLSATDLGPKTPTKPEKHGGRTIPPVLLTSSTPARPPERPLGHGISWPHKADLLEMLWTKRGTQIARELSCHPETVFKYADREDLPRPPHSHWLKHKFGDAIVIPEAIAAQIARLRCETPAPGTFPINQTKKHYENIKLV